MSEQKEKPKEPLKPCFIITPIGEPGLETFTKAMGLIKSVIEPVLKKFGFEAIPSNTIASPGSINKQIIQHLVNDELVIANVTGFNPNVMYELAIRHSFQKKVIIMAEKGPNLPFDIFDQRTIFYHDTLHGVTDAVLELGNMLEVVLGSDEVSNPIVDAIQDAAFVKNIAGHDATILTYLANKIDRIESVVNRKTQFNTQENSQRQFHGDVLPLNVGIVNYDYGQDLKEFGHYIMKYPNNRNGIVIDSVNLSHPLQINLRADTLDDLKLFQDWLINSGKFTIEN